MSDPGPSGTAPNADPEAVELIPMSERVSGPGHEAPAPVPEAKPEPNASTVWTTTEPIPKPIVDGNYRKTAGELLFQPIRKKISQRRARFEYQNINLDMAYITDRIIAIGYPSSGFEGVYRNTLNTTVEILKRRHGTEHVKVFNLRGGVFYDPKHFDYNVVAFNMIDHHPPRLELMAPFCREVKAWLDRDPKNVIAVHCKAGKGRTGVMICAYLIYIQFYSNPRQVLDYYSIVRTKNNKGVTIPSQRRYIYYYNYMRENKLNYFPRQMQLIGVYVERPPRTGWRNMKFKIRVSSEATTLFDPDPIHITGREFRIEKEAWKGQISRMKDPLSNCDLGIGSQDGLLSRRAYCFMVDEANPVFVNGDVRVDLLADGFSRFKSKKIGHVWFNTMFVCPNDPEKQFRYGDVIWPYNDHITSIAKKNLTERKVDVEKSGQPGKEDATESDKFVEYAMKDTGGTPPITLTHGLKILEPPGIDKHTPAESQQKIYTDHDMPLPRHNISHILYEAHKKGIVTDEFNDRRRKDCLDYRELRHVDPGKVGPPVGNDGPLQIKKLPDQHVLSFPVYEMDRAHKDKRLKGKGPRIYVVLRCVDRQDRDMVDKCHTFCQVTMSHDSAKASVADLKIPEEFRATPLADPSGAELRVPQTIRFASRDGNYNAKSDADLDDFAYADIPESRETEWARYFYKQRRDSVSRYPTTHECPLLVTRRGEMRVFAKGTSSEDDSSSGGRRGTMSSQPPGGNSSTSGGRTTMSDAGSTDDQGPSTSTSKKDGGAVDADSIPEFVSKVCPDGASASDPEMRAHFAKLMAASREMDRVYPGPGHTCDRLLKQRDLEDVEEEEFDDDDDEAVYRDDFVKEQLEELQNESKRSHDETAEVSPESTVIEWPALVRDDSENAASSKNLTSDASESPAVTNQPIH